MKIKTFALAVCLTFVGMGAASAVPNYVGENITPRDHVSLNFLDVPTDIEGLDTGNIASFEARGAWSPVENVSIRAGLPFFHATADALSGGDDSLTDIGNANMGVNWHMMASSPTDPMQWGYAVSLDAYLPTARDNLTGSVATSNPTTELYRYSSKTTSVVPTAGLFLEQDMFAAKANVGFGYGYNDDTEDSSTSFPIQVATSWRATPQLSANLEYNTIILDDDSAGTGDNFRHALTPSVSGDFNNLLASAFVTVPLDSDTQDIGNFSFGAEAGWAF